MAKKKTAGSAASGEAGNARSSQSSRRRRAAPPPDAAAASPLSTAEDRTRSMPEPAGQEVTPANTSASDSVTFLSQPQSAANGPTYEQIAEAAYHRYLSRGGQDGRDFDDWIEAEQELRGQS